MIAYAVVFLLGAAIGLGAGITWGDATLQLVREETARIEDELTKEIKRLRTQVATHIGGSL